MLQKEKSVVLARMEALERDALSVELDTDGVPSTGYEREQALGRLLNNRLADIENALERIESGSYGTCASCGNAIPPRRLEVHPFATLCVPCQSEADKKAKRQARA
jgi:RNA polymerase-binding transcription factor DksA